MEFYSDAKPDLIGPKIKSTIVTLMNKESNEVSMSTRIIQSLQSLFHNYIYDNSFVVVVILIIFIVLLLRYFYHKNNKKKQPIKTLSVDHFVPDKNITFEQVKNAFEQSPPPSFNPIEPVYDQYNPPSPIPINLPNNEGTVISDKLSYPNKLYKPLNNVPYDYDAVRDNPRAYYAGTYNTYQNATDSSVPNPLGLPVNFNTSTGDFVDYMTDQNNNNLDTYQSAIDNSNYQLTNHFNNTNDRSY